ncbi:MAG: 4Fe-4S dicluster domain-containing protein [Planctomycetes bacterium]|nr:4Fe-4S dicluster domain-containing protein [Planctomycetota bacterium]
MTSGSLTLAYGPTMTRSAKSSTGAAARSTIAVEIDEALCKGCGLCVAFCREQAIELAPTPNVRGAYAARVLGGRACCACRHCVLMCPEAAIRLFQT